MTRCECSDYDCARMHVENGQHRNGNHDLCTHNAVREVVVFNPGDVAYFGASYIPNRISACEPCAIFHEDRNAGRIK